MHLGRHDMNQTYIIMNEEGSGINTYRKKWMLRKI